MPRSNGNTTRYSMISENSSATMWLEEALRRIGAVAESRPAIALRFRKPLRTPRACQPEQVCRWAIGTAGLGVHWQAFGKKISRARLASPQPRPASPVNGAGGNNRLLT
jgi:hypothetical protein